jgi:hypothetical protein
LSSDNFLKRFEEMLQNVVKAIEQRIAEELTDTLEAIEQLIDEKLRGQAQEIEDTVDGSLDTHLAPANDHLVELVTSTDSETIMDKVDTLAHVTDLRMDAMSDEVGDLRNTLSQISEILERIDRRINRSLDQE